MVNRELKIMGIIVAVLVAVAIAWTLIGMKYGLGVSRNQGDDQTDEKVESLRQASEAGTGVFIKDAGLRWTL
ncbi:hypothetical protein SAMN02799624_05962 [Paenibacillus sp. UNC496MF]|uniref:hypothetical protein n=1 Tax=Paenibacillus sp. UNC496MF TaxID=1502753 RepID=UPI0008E45CB8|nr:hypothetical protein [Paenibacillus sp. UNC496MF]SFJ79052.1 hypothetical protein SAMN02799624_05962 [Paenibacillus sp. UNC496MF]